MASSARIDELLKKFEENPRRYFAPLANEYRKAGDVERAIQICREHLPQQPGHMSGHIVFGQALFEAQQFEESRQVLTAALALDPENLIALRHLGDIARGEGDVAAARDWYQRVLDADPRNDEIAAQLASLDSGEGMTPTDGAREASGDAVEFMSAPAGGLQSEAASGDDFTPIDLSADAFSGATSGTGGAGTPTGGDEAARDPASGSDQHDIAAMDFVLGSIPGNEGPRGGSSQTRGEEKGAGSDAFPTVDLDVEPDDRSAAFATATSRSDEALDSAYAAGGMGLDDDMELTPAHGASALVSRAEPPENEVTFDFIAETTDAADDSPLELADEGAVPSASHATPVPTSVPIQAIDDRPLGLESMEFVPPSRSAEPDPMLGHLLRDEEPSSATPSAFVTETMAELYLQQGFRDEALSVYRQLLVQSPGDENLRDRVAQLESGSRSSVSVAGISDTVIEAAQQRRAARAPQKTAREFFSSLANRRPAESAAWSSSAVVAGSEIADGGPLATPSATSEPGEAAVDEFGFPVNFDLEGAVVHRDLGAPRLEEEPRGLDLGDALIDDEPGHDAAEQLPASAAIEPATLDYAADELVEEPGAPDAAAASVVDAGSADRMAGDRYGQVEEPAFPTPVGLARLSGPVDTLFGDGAVPTQDAAAASTLASAFGGEGESPVTPSMRGPRGGTPAAPTTRPATGEFGSTSSLEGATATRPAVSELSLDHVFRDAPRRAGEKRREAPAFSFDQFFSDGAAAGVRGAAEPRTAPAPADGRSEGPNEGDIEQFNAWLEGLKKK